MVQKIYSKMHLVSCTNTHRDVTDLVNHGMVKNTKTWISWERNIIFLRNLNILNLCFRWHILSSYRFVGEVTFKELGESYLIKSCVFWSRSFYLLLPIFSSLRYFTSYLYIEQPLGAVDKSLLTLIFSPTRFTFRFLTCILIL